jgi:hypothetical protein
LAHAAREHDGRFDGAALQMELRDMPLGKFYENRFDSAEDRAGGIACARGFAIAAGRRARAEVPAVGPGNLRNQARPNLARRRPEHSNRARGRFWLSGCVALALLCFWFARPTPRPIEPSIAATQAAAAPPPKYVTANIEDLRLFQRVMAHNPQVSDEERAEFIDPDPATWRFIKLVMNKADGGRLDIELARPLDWLEEYQAEVGGTIDLDMPEVGAEGEALLLAIESCAPLGLGSGSPITGRFVHTAGNGVDLQVTGLNKPIGTTTNHPFWSDDRSEFVPAGALRPHERLRADDGTPVRVISATPWASPRRVYNIEVAGEHVYYVSDQGILVHNTYGGRRGNAATRAQLDDIRDAHLKANPTHVHVAGGRSQLTGKSLKEEYLRGWFGSRKGSSYVDLTFRTPDGRHIRYQTVDMTAEGIMTGRELRNHLRILRQTGEPLIAIPKAH